MKTCLCTDGYYDDGID